MGKKKRMPGEESSQVKSRDKREDRENPKAVRTDSKTAPWEKKL